MQSKQNIPRYKQKLLIFISALFIALTLQPKQTVYAGPEDGVNYSAYSSKGGTLSTTALAWSIIDGLYSGENGQKQLLEDAKAYNFDMIDFNSRDSNVQSAIIQSLKELLARHIKEALDAGLGDSLEGSGRVFTSPPLIGTVPNLLEYKNNDPMITSNPFYSYTNRTAPFSERAIADGVAERAGFQVWSGGTSSEITDADVMNNGLAMVIITANSDMQTTCDEPLQPSPHQPLIESTGHTTIVKSYRTKNMTTGELVDDGTFSPGDLGTQILIENKTESQVIDWKTSTTTNTSISSLSRNPPSIVPQQGKPPTSVTLDPTETCLYLEHQ